jgi:hypothetical protein
MYKEVFIMAENAKTSRLVAEFNTLDDNDKDLVIEMSEFLVENHGNTAATTTATANEKTDEEIRDGR